MNLKFWLSCLLTVAAVSTTLCPQRAAAQNNSTGPTLPATMQYLQSSINGVGELHWVMRYHDSADNTNWNYTFSFLISNLVADPNTCTIKYHYIIIRDGVKIFDGDTSTNLHDAQDLTLITGDLRQNKNDVIAGHTTWTAKGDPMVFDLILQAKDKSEYYFFFTNEEMANSVTKAMGHAIDLCGGSRGSF